MANEVAPVSMRDVVRELSTKAHVMPTPTDRASAIVETLLIVAGWLDSDRDRQTLIELAEQVKQYDTDWGWEEAWACPVCDEVHCDEGCPALPLRQPLTE